MDKIIVATTEELKQMIKECIPASDKLSPEERYVTTEELSKILKISVSHVHYLAGLGMYGDCGENLWEWQECIRWKKDVYSKITKGNRKRSK
jgi:hypothetical protein